jgi:two-component system response regulator YesN
MSEMFKRKLFRNIFLSFSVVIIFYTGIIMYVTVSQEYKRNRVEFDNLNELFLERESSSIDYRMDVSLNAVNLISKQKSISNYLSESTFSYDVYNQMFSDLTGNLFSNHQLGFNLAITKGYSSDITSQDGYFLFEDYLKFINLDNQMGELKKFMESDNNNDLRCFDAGTKLVILKKSYFFQEKQNIFFFIVWEKSALSSIALPGNQGEFGLIDANHLSSSLVSSEDSQIKQFLPFETETFNQISFGKKGNFWTYQKRSSTIPTIYYLYSVRTNQTPMIPTQTIWFILCVLFVLLIVGFILTFLLSRRNYLPFEEIMRNIGSVKEDRRGDDLAYILSTIQDINEINQKLEMIQESSIEDLQETFFKNLIYDNYDVERIETRLKPLRLEKFKKGGVLVVLSIGGISALESNLSEENILILRKKIVAFFNEKDSDTSFLSFPIDYKHFCLFFSEKDQRIILTILTKMIDRIEQELSVDVTFSISKVFDSLLHFSEAFKEAYQLSEKRYSFIDNHIISAKSVPITSKKNYLYSVETEALLIKSIQTNDAIHAQKILLQLLEDNLDRFESDIYSLYDFKNVLLNTMKRILNKYDLSFTHFSRENQELFRNLNSTDSILLKDTFMEMLEKLLELVGEKNTLNLSTIEKVLVYIRSNYTRDLSLSEVAEEFNLSESYVSKLIKEHLKTSFKSYINQLKVEKAKELLDTGKYKVSEVAELVGCKNVNTFIRIFKQHEGTTPGKYLTDSHS